MRKKQILLIVIAFVLVLPSFLVNATTQSNSNTNKTVTYTEGEISSKDEVVYATLSATGALNEIYVVNILDVITPGTIVDFGRYTAVKNLTDLSEIEQHGHTVRIDAPVGKFFYQGNMSDQDLPWDFSVTYLLNGIETDPKKLVGSDGNLEIKITSSPNQYIDPTFFEYYILQVSLLLNSDVFYSDIEAEDGTIANVGKNRQVNFTVLPEEEGILTLKADVKNFEMEGIEIAAIPFSMAFDVDIDDMTGDIKTLTDAIQEISNGVSELRSGISELNDGVKSLRDGSQAFKEGMEEIDGASSQIVDGSSQIKDGIDSITESVTGSLDVLDLTDEDITEWENLLNEFSELVEELREVAEDLNSIEENYSEALDLLDEAMSQIPDYTITDEEIEELLDSDVDLDVINRLLETYNSSVNARETYEAVRDNFDHVDTVLSDIRGSILDLSKTIESVSDELNAFLENFDLLQFINEFEEGMATFASSYDEFHSGLVSYTNGVSELTKSYGELHSGLVDLAKGTEELEDGVGELEDGTNKLADSTKNLPDELRSEIDKMIAEFDKTDFDPVSFVSAENEKINNVQFVIKTDSIKIDKDENEIEEEDKPKGFWARLLSLFF